MTAATNQVSPDLTIYLVQGDTGEYDDYWAWPVRCYLDRAEAEAHAKRAKTRADVICTQVAKEDDWKKHQEILAHNEEDPDMRQDYNGTHYEVVEIPINRAALAKAVALLTPADIGVPFDHLA